MRSKPVEALEVVATDLQSAAAHYQTWRSDGAEHILGHEKAREVPKSGTGSGNRPDVRQNAQVATNPKHPGFAVREA